MCCFLYNKENHTLRVWHSYFAFSTSSALKKKKNLTAFLSKTSQVFLSWRAFKPEAYSWVIHKAHKTNLRHITGRKTRNKLWLRFDLTKLHEAPLFSASTAQTNLASVSTTLSSPHIAWHLHGALMACPARKIDEGENRNTSPIQATTTQHSQQEI